MSIARCGVGLGGAVKLAGLVAQLGLFVGEQRLWGLGGAVKLAGLVSQLGLAVGGSACGVWVARPS